MLAALTALVALGWMSIADAATPIQASGAASSSIWIIDGANVRVRVMVPTAAAKQLAAKGAPPPGLATVASAVSQGVSVTTPAGDCEAVDQGEGVGQIYILALTPGLDRFEIVFACPQATGLVLKDDLLFDRDPGHIAYAQIRVGASQPVLQAFTHDRRTIALPASAAQLHGADPLTFTRQAAIRLATDVAALGIVLGSVLLSRRWLDLAWFAASLAIGYLVSIALGLWGVVALDQGLAQALTGVLVATLGLGALHTGEAVVGSRWRWVAWVGVGMGLAGLVVAAALRAPMAGLATGGIAIFGLGAVRAGRAGSKAGFMVFAPAALFAFLDGLGPAGDLALLHPSAGQIVPILIGHDLGGMLAAIAVAGVAMGLIWLAGRRLAGWRGIGSELGGAALIGLGLFWFVTRLYS